MKGNPARSAALLAALGAVCFTAAPAAGAHLLAAATREAYKTAALHILLAERVHTC